MMGPSPWVDELRRALLVLTSREPTWLCIPALSGIWYTSEASDRGWSEQASTAEAREEEEEQDVRLPVEPSVVEMEDKRGAEGGFLARFLGFGRETAGVTDRRRGPRCNTVSGNMARI